MFQSFPPPPPPYLCTFCSHHQIFTAGIPDSNTAFLGIKASHIFLGNSKPLFMKFLVIFLSVFQVGITP